jgi:hypothetical protein
VAFRNVLTILSNIPYLKSAIPSFSFFAHSPVPGRVLIDSFFSHGLHPLVFYADKCTPDNDTVACYKISR